VSVGAKGLAGLSRYRNEFITPQVIVFLLLAGLLATAGQAQEPTKPAPAAASSGSPALPVNVAPPSERVILKVGDLQVTQADFESMIRALEAQQGPADLSRRAIADNYSSLLMLSQQAVANNLESSPDVVRQLALDRTQILSNAEFSKLKAQAKPTEEEIKAYYSAHLDDYDVVQMRRLFIWTNDGSKDGHGLSQQDATALAAAVRRAYVSGGDAKQLIHDTVDDPNSVVYDAQPLTFQRGELPARMEQAAFALKEGGWTELNDAPGTYVFLQLVQRSRKDLKEVSPQIERKLQAQKLQEELDDLKKKAGIWMDEQYFGTAPQKSVSGTQSQASGPSKSANEQERN
jgi:PPIC-type PPIASE domain